VDMECCRFFLHPSLWVDHKILIGVDLRAACGTGYPRGGEIVEIILDDYKIFRVGGLPCEGPSRRMYTKQVHKGSKPLQCN
jgi:hypothetical protein